MQEILKGATNLQPSGVSYEEELLEGVHMKPPSVFIERRINNATIKAKKGEAQSAGCIRAKVTERQPGGRLHRPEHP